MEDNTIVIEEEGIEDCIRNLELLHEYQFENKELNRKSPFDKFNLSKEIVEKVAREPLLDVRHVKPIGQNCRLGALPGARRTQQHNSHETVPATRIGRLR